jgi:hypothetical protein
MRETTPVVRGHARTDALCLERPVAEAWRRAVKEGDPNLALLLDHVAMLAHLANALSVNCYRKTPAAGA